MHLNWNRRFKLENYVPRTFCFFSSVTQSKNLHQPILRPFCWNLQNLALRKCHVSMHTEACVFHKITVFAKIYEISPCESIMCFLVTKSNWKIYQQISSVRAELNPSAGFWKFVNLRVLLCRNVVFFRTLKKKKKKNERRILVNLGVSFLSGCFPFVYTVSNSENQGFFP